MGGIIPDDREDELRGAILEIVRKHGNAAIPMLEARAGGKDKLAAILTELWPKLFVAPVQAVPDVPLTGTIARTFTAQAKVDRLDGAKPAALLLGEVAATAEITFIASAQTWANRAGMVLVSGRVLSLSGSPVAVGDDDLAGLTWDMLPAQLTNGLLQCAVPVHAIGAQLELSATFAAPDARTFSGVAVVLAGETGLAAQLFDRAQVSMSGTLTGETQGEQDDVTAPGEPASPSVALVPGGRFVSHFIRDWKKNWRRVPLIGLSHDITLAEFEAGILRPALLAGDNRLDCYAWNAGSDVGGIAVNVPEHAAQARQKADMARTAGCPIRLWLLPDDSGGGKAWATKDLLPWAVAAVRAVNPIEAVLCLEPDEWNEDAELDALGAHVKAAFPALPIYTHTNPMDSKGGNVLRFASRSWCFGALIQTNGPRDNVKAADVERLIRQAWAAIRKPVAAMEYAFNVPAVGDQLLARLGSEPWFLGVGCGASQEAARAFLLGTSIESTQPVPNRPADALNVSNMTTLGKNRGMHPGKAIIKKTLHKAKNEGANVRLSFDPLTGWKTKPWDNGKVTDGGVCIAWQEGGSVIGGLFDHHGVQQTVKTQENVRKGYLDGRKPAPGTPVFYWLQNYDNTERTNVVAGGVWT